ncbi:hypothetical protein F0562_004631 [Nyssa sinensis]|uniref:Uncharacterized protein n=1 Tax=Nyssa sinensis TaxID=561372 RepID=A0A5J5BYT9_9ASTE|nr:hypothetical protein F0562_004631 [Nyssa sinensis]
MTFLLEEDCELKSLKDFEDCHLRTTTSPQGFLLSGLVSFSSRSRVVRNGLLPCSETLEDTWSGLICCFSFYCKAKQSFQVLKQNIVLPGLIPYLIVVSAGTTC